jgi:hypothetical protein
MCAGMRISFLDILLRLFWLRFQIWLAERKLGLVELIDAWPSTNSRADAKPLPETSTARPSRQAAVNVPLRS